MARIKEQIDGNPPASEGLPLKDSYQTLLGALNKIALDDYNGAAESAGQAAQQLQGIVDSGSAADADALENIITYLKLPEKPSTAALGQKQTSSSKTIKQDSAMTTLELGVLRKLWPNGDQHIAGLLEGMAATAPNVFPKYGLTTPLVVAHFMAQVSEECAAGLEMQENMNYTAQRLLEIFPTHFTPALAARAAHNPQMIAEIAYGGRMGNEPPPSTDGWVFRGQGLTQCTGRDEYAKLGQTVGFDLVSNPSWLIDPDHTLECGAADFVSVCGCLPFAKNDDVVGVTKRLNGGLNGLADREAWLAKWKIALSVS
jgi:putative chitinase